MISVGYHDVSGYGECLLRRAAQIFMSREAETLYVDSAAALEELCGRLVGSEWLAMDTEFQRERTYYPKLCLLQMATPDLVAFVDTLAIADLEPLLALLYRPEITKVMHAAGQDMEILYHLRGELPGSVFDTQLAAPLLGYSDQQIGYADLVHRMLGVRLAKAHTRTDWTRRPLSPEQLDYAADDVRYLAALYPPIRQKLAASGRLAWLEEDFEALCEPARYSVPPEDAWRRVRAAVHLGGAKLSVLQALAAWRERTARLKDTPRNWLMRDDALVEVAKRLPDSREALIRIKGLKPRFIRVYAKELLDVVAEARERSPRGGANLRRVPLSSDQAALADALSKLVAERAARESLEPSLLAGRRELERLVAGERDLSVLRGWRRHMVGDALLAFVRGG